MKFIEVDNHHESFSSNKYPKLTCVYFLFYKKELRYIGKTKNLSQRMSAHHGLTSMKLFDTVGYIPCKTVDDAEFLEQRMINKYSPPENSPFSVVSDKLNERLSDEKNGVIDEVFK